MSYPKIKIGEIAKVKGGKRLPKGYDFAKEETNHPYIRARDIRDGIIRLDDPVYIDEEVFEKIKRYTVKTNDVCIVIVGANVGDVGIVPYSLNCANLTENAIKLTEIRDDCDSIFLKYSLLTEEPKHQMKLFAAGAAQPKLGIYKINDIEISFPKFTVQRKIASILSAYDDLIENNNRRIKILEEMAQAIYKEWFTYPFRGTMGTSSPHPSPSGRGSHKAHTRHEKYPLPEGEGKGKGSVRLVKSELGIIPEGWVIDILENICHRITDGSHFSPKAVPNGRPMASVKDMHDWGFYIDKCKIIGEDDFQKLVRNDCKPLKDDVLIAKDGSYLKHVFVVELDMNLVILSSIAILRPNNRVNPHFLATHLREPLVMARLKGYVSGVALPRVVLKDFRKFKILLPPKQLQDRWAEIVTPMIKNCWRLIDKNNNLRKTRDLLLPKLISGEIDVGNMDIQMMLLNLGH